MATKLAPRDVRVAFTFPEADALLNLARWAKQQGYGGFTEHAITSGYGVPLRLAVNKLGVATCEPDWERRS